MKIIHLINISFVSLTIGCSQPQNSSKETEQIDLSAALQPIPSRAILEDNTYFTWGASPIKDEKGVYHIYYSRWKKEHGFAAWVTHSEIAHGVSNDLFGPYVFKDVALPERGANYWDGHTTHNPTIQKWGNTYYLYYMGNSGDRKDCKGDLNWIHRNNQRIGVAVSDSPYGPWKRFSHPLLTASTDTTAADALAVSNPSVTRRTDGKFLMVYKAIGKKKPLPFGGPVVHLTAIADSPTGPFVKNPNPIFTNKDSFFAAEDPYIWYQDQRYYAIVKDMKGEFTHKGRSLALFTSKDGYDWQLAEHPLVSELILNWEGNRKDTIERLERPQLYIENGIPQALFLAVTPKGIKGHTYNVHIPIKFDKE